METMFDYISSLSLASAHLALNMVWLGLALTVVVALVWRFTRPNEPGIRYAAWWSVLTVVIALPFLVNGTTGRLLGGDASLQETADVSVDSNHEARTPATAASIDRTANPDRSDTEIASSQKRSANSHVMTASEIKSEPKAQPSIGSVLLVLLPMTLFLTWLAVAGLLLARLWSAHRSMVSIKRASRPLDLRYWPTLEKLLHKERGERAVEIRTSGEINLPMAAGLGHPVILMPDHLVDELTAQEFEAIVRHELAHIQRWDDWTKLLQKIVEALAFFHPAVRWIGRQLDLEREMACDEQVVRQTGDPTAYAQCLTRLAQLTTGSATSLVPGALNGRKQIFKRIGSLLNRSSNRRRYSRVRITAFIFSVLVALFFMVQVAPVIAVPGKAVTLDELSQTVRALMPEVAEEPEVESAEAENASSSEPAAVTQQSSESKDTSPSGKQHSAQRADTASGGKRSRDRGVVGQAWDWASDTFDEFSHGTSHHINDGHHRIRWSDGRSRIQVELDGEIEFTDDDRRIKSISRRGYVTVQEKRGSKRRELEIEPNSDGSLYYIYELNGEMQDFDEDAQEWFAEIILDIIQNSAVGANKRVQRFYAADGVDGVVQEMLDIESDYVRGVYFQELAAIDGLTSEEYGKIITEAGHQMDSDYEKAEFLISLVDNLKENPELKKLFVDAVATVDSDYEKRRILSELTLGGETDPELIMTVLVIADEIDSDYERAELLIELAPVVMSDSVLLTAYVEAVEAIDSDYETRRVLSELAFDDDVDEEIVLMVLRIARTMDSDYEKAELLIDMAPYSSQYAQARDAYLTAIRNTDSDYETRRIISALSDKRKLDHDGVEDLLFMAEEMESDYEKAELLIELSELCEDDTDLLTTMMRSTATLDSDYESRRVLSSLRLDCETQPELTEAMLLIVESLDSDYETAEILIELAECAATNDQFRDSYLRASENLDSDYERSRVLTELFEETDEPDSAMIVGILAVVEDMDSDFEKSELLNELAPFCRGNDYLEERYTDVVETMDSDYEIDRAYSRLHRRTGRTTGARSN